MSLRYIPYGYKFEDGRPVPHPDESQTVREIFTRYCAGESLKAIAEGLTQRQIAYIPGKTDWNKARIKRMLENSRYAGEGEYPAIIEKEQFVAANLMKDSANKCKATVGPEIKLFKEFVVCAECGLPLKRRVDSRFAESVSWKCETCGWAVRLGDEDLKHRVIYLEGDSLSAIKHRLETMGVKTASGRNSWNTAVIQNMLSQEKYRGDALLQKTYKASLFDKRSRVNNLCQYGAGQIVRPFAGGMQN